MRVPDPTCKASVLVKRLQEFINTHGDLPIYVDDPDTHWRLPIGLVFRPTRENEGLPNRFEIKTEYHRRPKGDLGVDIQESPEESPEIPFLALVEAVKKVNPEAAHWMYHNLPGSEGYVFYPEAENLFDSFVWRSTPQGHNFWSEIAGELPQRELV
jgi:hypothetical protein